jgi:hypothetical protein
MGTVIGIVANLGQIGARQFGLAHAGRAQEYE